MTKTNLRIVERSSGSVSPPLDPLAGNIARNHPELAARIAFLRDRERNGTPVAHEIEAVVVGWERNR